MTVVPPGVDDSCEYRSLQERGADDVFSRGSRFAVRNPSTSWGTTSVCAAWPGQRGVIGQAVLTDKNRVVLGQVAPMCVPNSGLLFTLFDFPVPVGAPEATERAWVVDADNPSGLPHNDFRVTVPPTFGRALPGASYAGFQPCTVVAGDTLFGIAKNAYGDGTLWPRLFTANQDTISDPELIRAGQVLRVPVPGP